MKRRPRQVRLDRASSKAHGSRTGDNGCSEAAKEGNHIVPALSVGDPRFASTGEAAESTASGRVVLRLVFRPSCCTTTSVVLHESMSSLETRSRGTTSDGAGAEVAQRLAPNTPSHEGRAG